MTPLEHNRVKNAATHFPISGSVDYMQTTKMKESIQVLRKSKQNLSKSMTKFKQGTLFFLPPPPTTTQLWNSQGLGKATAVHSTVPEARIWKGREEGKNRQVPEQRLEEAPLPLHSFPPGIPHTLGMGAQQQKPPWRACWENTGLYQLKKKMDQIT